MSFLCSPDGFEEGMKRGAGRFRDANLNFGQGWVIRFKLMKIDEQMPAPASAGARPASWGLR
jgi:hypothetical protein